MLPPFVAPIQRPEIVQPFLTVDLRDGDGSHIVQTIFDLIHGKNYNDPQRFLSRDYHKLKSSMHYSSSPVGRFRR
jgi:cyanobactin biosynthesis protein (PatB/AcyB/McaB family)